jgi:hypothetical protein
LDQAHLSSMLVYGNRLCEIFRMNYSALLL